MPNIKKSISLPEAMFNEVVKRRLGDFKAANFSHYVQDLIKKDIVGITSSDSGDQLNEPAKGIEPGTYHLKPPGVNFRAGTS